jgi:hypothetical protein
VGHSLLSHGGNHWCLYLQVGETQSVRIDVVPSYTQPSTILQGGSKANIVISYLEYVVSNSATCTCTMAVCSDLKVGWVLDLFINSGRHKYEFDSQGRGCRNWTQDQITLLLEQRYLTSSAEADAAKAAILIEYPTLAAHTITPGAYYQ